MKVNTAALFSLSHMAPSQPAGGQPPPVRTDTSVDRSPRVRTTTLDRFNQEMSVLEHSLDEEVEYYDEPRPHRWRGRAIGMAIFALSCGGFLTAARYRHAPQMAARELPAGPPAVGVVAAVLTPPAAPAAPAPAPTTAVRATPEATGADKPASPSKLVALAETKANGHHHRHARHASGRHHHGGHSHHLI